MYIMSEDIQCMLKLKMQSQNHMKGIFPIDEKEYVCMYA